MQAVAAAETGYVQSRISHNHYFLPGHRHMTLPGHCSAARVPFQRLFNDSSVAVEITVQDRHTRITTLCQTTADFFSDSDRTVVAASAPYANSDEVLALMFVASQHLSLIHI